MKSDRDSPPDSLLDSSTKHLATHLKRRSKKAQSNRSQGYVVSYRKPPSTAAWQLKCSHPHRKKLELVDEAKKYHLDIAGVSSVVVLYLCIRVNFIACQPFSYLFGNAFSISPFSFLSFFLQLISFSKILYFSAHNGVSAVN